MPKTNVGHTKTPWAVYQCQFCKEDTNNQSACGFNGSSLDASGDECHHTLSIEDALHIVRCVNSHEALVEALNMAKQYIGSNNKSIEKAEIVYRKIESALKLESEA